MKNMFEKSCLSNPPRLISSHSKGFGHFSRFFNSFFGGICLSLSYFLGEGAVVRALRATNAGEVNISRSVLPHRCCTAHSSPTATPLLENRRGERCAAFTLAEVLITLTIIGVIAALTIPNLMRKWEDQHTVSAVKKAYATIDSAFKLAVQENGPLLDWNWPDKREVYSMENYRYMAEKLLPYLKIQKYCPSTMNKNEYNKCIPYNKNYSEGFQKHGWHYYSYLNNTYDTGSSLDKYDGYTLLQNGMSVTYMPVYLASGCAHTNALTDYIGQIIIDINGQKGPNKIGYDAFRFTFNQTGLFVKYHRENPGCWYENASNGCSNNQSTGTTCGAWVIKHGNMDYKYRDVSAEW